MSPERVCTTLPARTPEMGLLLNQPTAATLSTPGQSLCRQEEKVLHAAPPAPPSVSSSTVSQKSMYRSPAGSSFFLCFLALLFLFLFSVHLIWMATSRISVCCFFYLRSSILFDFFVVESRMLKRVKCSMVVRGDGYEGNWVVGSVISSASPASADRACFFVVAADSRLSAA